MTTVKTFVLLEFMLIVLVSNGLVGVEGTCFKFNGTTFLLFSLPETYNNENNVHYSLEFRTSNLKGVIMYARGAYGDNESLYVKGGKLHYILFNMARSGVGRQFGGHFVSNERVDTDSWVKVNLYRSWTSPNVPAHLNSGPKTGFDIEINGAVRSYTDGSRREGIEITPAVYFGGYSASLGEVGNFTGEIRSIREHKNGFSFNNPTINFRSWVSEQCDN